MTAPGAGSCHEAMGQPGMQPPPPFPDLCLLRGRRDGETAPSLQNGNLCPWARGSYPCGWGGGDCQVPPPRRERPRGVVRPKLKVCSTCCVRAGDADGAPRAGGRRWGWIPVRNHCHRPPGARAARHPLPWGQRWVQRWGRATARSSSCRVMGAEGTHRVPTFCPEPHIGICVGTAVGRCPPRPRSGRGPAALGPAPAAPVGPGRVRHLENVDGSDRRGRTRPPAHPHRAAPPPPRGPSAPRNHLRGTGRGGRGGLSRLCHRTSCDMRDPREPFRPTHRGGDGAVSISGSPGGHGTTGAASSPSPGDTGGGNERCGRPRPRASRLSPIPRGNAEREVLPTAGSREGGGGNKQGGRGGGHFQP